VLPISLRSLEHGAHNDGIFGQFRDRKRRGEKGRRYRCRLDLWLADVMGVEGIPIPYGAPNASPHIERFNLTLRTEALDHFVFLNVGHVLAVCRQSVKYYSTGARSTGAEPKGATRRLGPQLRHRQSTRPQPPGPPAAQLAERAVRLRQGPRRTQGAERPSTAGRSPPPPLGGITTHDADLDLIDMGGRVYDPSAARFLSADPILQAPTWSQGSNRYSHVFNNPTNLTDPSGYQSFNDVMSTVVPGFVAIGHAGTAVAATSGLGAAVLTYAMDGQNHT
jgi:RHS repeat-associated protein